MVTVPNDQAAQKAKGLLRTGLEVALPVGLAAVTLFAVLRTTVDAALPKSAKQKSAAQQ